MEFMSSSSCSTSTFHPNLTKQTPPIPRLSSSIKPASTPLRFAPRSRSLRLRLDRRDAGIAVSSRGAAVPWCSAAGIPEKVGPFERKRLAVFVSGWGSNFRSLHEAALKGEVRGDVAVLVTDKPSCGGAKYAAENGIPTLLFPKSKSSVDGMSAVELVASLRQLDIDFVLLAGFLKLISVELVQAFPRSILNIHPSLLPSFGGKGFYGAKVHQAVIECGARYSGPTIHFVDEHYDTGRILAQRVVPVLATDTPEELAKRVLHEEHKLYVHVVAALCEGRIIWRDDGVPLIQNKENPNEYS